MTANGDAPVTVKRVVTAGLATALVASLAGHAMAQSAALKAANDRHEHFEQLGKNFKAVKDSLDGKPDRAVIVRNANAIKTASDRLPTWFPQGSGKEVRPKSEALPKIWSDPAGFTAAAAKLKVEAGKLAQVSAKGDVSAVRAQFQATAGACSGCHKVYREKKS